MKKSKLFMLLFSAMVAFAAMAFTSCVDDNDDQGLPYLEVTPDVINFDANGVAPDGASIVIKTNRPWRATVEKDKEWVRLSATDGKGNGTINVSVPASNSSDQAKVSIATYNSYGDLIVKTVTIVQGTVKPTELIFKETFGTEGTTTTPYPTVDNYTGWVTSGSGASTVTFAGQNAQLRNSSASTGQYSGYNGSGGSNLYFAAVPNDFIVKDITIPADVTEFKLSFGAYIFNPDNANPYYTTYSVAVSTDGTTWSDPVPFEITFVTGKSWNLATSKFKLGQYSSKLYLKFSAVSGNNRIDDVILETGNGGTEVTYGGVVVTTNDATDVNTTGATLSGAVSKTEGVTAVGFQYIVNSSSIDWAASTKVAADAVATTFTKAITGLTTGTTYAVRAYATTSKGDVYAAQSKTFTPAAPPSADDITVDFSNAANYPSGFPTATGTNQLATYKFGGFDFAIAGSSDGAYYQATSVGTDKYLMLGKTGAYIEFPANAAKPLTQVIATTRKDASKNVIVGVYNASNQPVTGGEAVKWDQVDGKVAYTYDLTGTTANTKYRLYVTNAYNAQLVKLEVKYGVSTTPAVSVNPTTLEFTDAADNTGKTVAVTVSNQGAYNLYAESSDNTQFPTTLSGTTVTVKALANTTTQVKEATVKVYLATAPTAARVAEASVAVSQSAPAPTTVTTIADVIAGGADKAVLIQGTVVAKSAQSIVVKDNTGLLYCYLGAAPADNVGNTVKVSGTTQLYGNIIQIGSENAVVTTVSTGSYTQPTPQDIDGAAITAYVNGTAPLAVKYVKYTGELSISGNFYNVTVDGTSVKGSILYPATGFVDPALNGKNVIVEGYTVGTPNSNKNFMNTVATTVTEGAASTETVLAKWVFAAPTDTNATEGNTASTISRVGVATTISYTASSKSIWCNGWDGADVTPKYWLLTIPHTAAIPAGTQLKIDWGAWGTATSPKNWDIEYSTDNSTWTKIASEVYTTTNNATHSLTTAALASQIAAGTLYVRFKVVGTVPIDPAKTVVEAGGNSRMANISVYY